MGTVGKGPMHQLHTIEIKLTNHINDPKLQNLQIVKSPGLKQTRSGLSAEEYGLKQ